MTSVAILATGSCLPERAVSNDEAGAAAGVDDAWTTRKTAIRERRWAAPGQATSDLATVAARSALHAAGVTPDQLSAIVVATSTPDRPQPPTAAYVQQRLGAADAAAFDLNAVCSGFVFALATVEAMLARSGGHALVIGADVYSRILDPADRRTVVLFGDGAGAVVLGPATPVAPPGTSRSGHAAGQGRAAAHARVRFCSLHTFGELSDLIKVPAGGSRLPCGPDVHDAGLGYFTMDGRAVRAFVQNRLPVLVKEFLHDAAVLPGDIAHFVPHQANGVLLDEVLGDLALPRATVHRTLERYGNTGAASIPVTLDAAARQGEFRPGDLVLLAGFGGGMAAGFALVEW